MGEWMVNAASWTVLTVAKLSKLAAANIEEIALEYRRKNGFDLSNFEEPYTEAQYLRMATMLRTAKMEKFRGKVGESVVLRPDNFPELSRRQARKVAEYWRLIESVNAPK